MRAETRRSKLKRIAGLAVIAVAVWYMADAVIYMDLWSSVPEKAPGVCRLVPDLPGAEDMAVARDGTVIVSINRRGDRGADKGALVALSLRTGAQRVLWDGGPRGFRPHGIDYLRTPDGREFVYAIDHAPQGDRVMIFRLAGDRLELVREVPHPRKTLNDVAAVDASRFYVTVDHDLDNAAAIAVSDYLRLPTGHVEWFDGASFRRVSESLRYPNGIALSPGLRQVYVASMLGGAVNVYRREGDRLVRQRAIRVPGSPDNLSLSDDGALLVATHPKILDLAHQRRDRRFRAPSRVLRVEAPGSASPAVETIFSDPGARVSSASVGLIADGKLLVGTVFDSVVAVCEMGRSARSLSDP